MREDSFGMKLRSRAGFCLAAFFLAFTFASCSVNESDSLKTFSIYVPSSLAIVSKPSGESELYDFFNADANIGNEWYEYSNFSIRQIDGFFNQNVQNFHFDTAYPFTVADGTYQLDAVAVMTKYLGGDSMLSISTYKGSSIAKISADDELKIYPMTISMVCSEKVNEFDYLDTMDDFDYRDYLPGTVTLMIYTQESIDDPVELSSSNTYGNVSLFSFGEGIITSYIEELNWDAKDDDGNDVEVYYIDGGKMPATYLDSAWTYYLRTRGKNVTVTLWNFVH